MGAKLNVSYKIETVIDGTVKPGDELKGKVFIRNEESKAQKLKGVNATVAAFYNEDVWEEDFFTKDWGIKAKDQRKPLKDYPIFQSDTKIEPGDTQEFDFVIKLPSFPGARPYGWFVALVFYAKSGGLFGSGAKDADDATCILPVPGSTRMPTFGEIPGGPVVDPPRNPPPRPTGLTPSQAREGRREEQQNQNRFSAGPSFGEPSFSGPSEPSAPSPPSRPSFGPSRSSFGGARGGGGMQCIKCHGSGQCNTCHGTGRFGAFSCNMCNGSGKCDWCKGTGQQ